MEAVIEMSFFPLFVLCLLSLNSLVTSFLAGTVTEAENCSLAESKCWHCNQDSMFPNYDNSSNCVLVASAGN